MLRLLTRAFALFFTTVCCLLLYKGARAESCDQNATDLATTPAIEQSVWKIDIAKQSVLNHPSEPDVVLIGDSLAYQWLPYFRRDFHGEKVWNLGVPGDRTQNVLWRLARLPDVKEPKHVILFVGTNNLAVRGAVACSVTAGIEAVIAAIRSKWRGATLFVMPIFPRGESFAQFDKRRRAINRRLKMSADDGRRTVVDVDEEEFTCSDLIGKQCQNYQPDNLHFTSRGYALISSYIAAADD